MSAARGHAAEDAALRYLEAHGFALLARNYRCRLGEIDLVMRDGNSLVFVEVRARRSSSHGGAAASVGHAKQRRLVAAARHFLMTHPDAAKMPARFDVVTLSGPGEDATPRHLRQAFDGAN